MTAAGAGAALRRRGVRLVGCALTAVLLAGCAQSVDPLERMGRKAAGRVRPHHRAPAPDLVPARETARPPVPEPAAEPVSGPAGSAAPGAHRRWGLPRPLAPAPAAPARRVLPRRAPGSTPPVLTRVPTRDAVVFLTYDSTATARDPRLAALIRDLRLPVTLFLDERTTSPGHDPYGRLHALGAGIGNHTLTHPFLPGLGYARQHTEICAQQDNLKSRFGAAPRLLHPPSNTYDATTLRAAAACRIAAIVLPRTPARGTLRAGDILRPARGATPSLLREIQSRHLAVATLEDYI